MASILLACPSCKKRISSSAHSCPNCGEPLSDEWEAKGRTQVKHQRIGYAILLVPLLFFGSAAVVGIYEGSIRQAGPVTPSSEPAVPPKVAQTTVRALGFKDGNGQRGLFAAIREKQQTFEGRQVLVFCPADGTGEIVALVNGEYVAVNGAARGWAGSKTFWAVQGQQLIPISDSGFPNDVPKRLALLERHMNAVIETGGKMCPLAAPALDSAWKSLRSALGNYEANARSLGISIP